jgi:hypothetical protein
MGVMGSLARIGVITALAGALTLTGAAMAGCGSAGTVEVGGQAAVLQAKADAARGSKAKTPYVSPELAAAQARLQELRRAGGWAYKSGAVDRAEADVRALSGPRGAPREVMMGRDQPVQRSRNWGKPIEGIQRAYR